HVPGGNVVGGVDVALHVQHEVVRQRVVQHGDIQTNALGEVAGGLHQRPAARRQVARVSAAAEQVLTQVGGFTVLVGEQTELQGGGGAVQITEGVNGLGLADAAAEIAAASLGVTRLF